MTEPVKRPLIAQAYHHTSIPRSHLYPKSPAIDSSVRIVSPHHCPSSGVCFVGGGHIKPPGDGTLPVRIVISRPRTETAPRRYQYRSGRAKSRTSARCAPVRSRRVGGRVRGERRRPICYVRALAASVGDEPGGPAPAKTGHGVTLKL